MDEAAVRALDMAGTVETFAKITYLGAAFNCRL